MRFCAATPVTVHGRRLTVKVDARGVLKDLQHAMHIHSSADSSHICPSGRIHYVRTIRTSRAVACGILHPQKALVQLP